MSFSVILYFYACMYNIYIYISTPLVFGVLDLYNYIYCIILYDTLPFFGCVLMDVVVHCGSIGDPIFDPGIHIATAMSPWPGCCLRQDVPEVFLDALQVYWTLHQADGSLFTW